MSTSAGLIPGRPRAAAEDWMPVARFLIKRCGLSEQDVRRILELKDAEELRFTEAALRLGLITQADVDAYHGQAPLPPADAPAEPAPELTLLRDPYHPQSERLRALRTELLLRRPDTPGGAALAVVSAEAGEGRSRLAAELAVAFAQLGEPTLLVDADLRRPRQQQLFRAASPQGLSETLAKQTAPRLHPVAGLPALSVLLAGERPGNPLELLSGPLLGELLGGWRRRFRHIVFDTPAVSQVSDALAVATHVGRVLVLARAGRTGMAAHRAMLQRLAVTDALVLGAVLLHR